MAVAAVALVAGGTAPVVAAPGAATASATSGAASSATTAELPQPVTADALPTVQVDGVVWDVLVVGDRAYATGSFKNARPAGAAPGTQQTPRSNILAFDVRTGALLPGFTASLDAQGLALEASADGSRIFVAGDFTRVNGVARSRVAALDPATGALVTGFRADANARVRALAVKGSTLYLGGIFTTVNGQSRTRLAAVAASTGGLGGWRPSADAEVMDLVAPATTGTLVAAGRFTTLGGQAAPGSGALDALSGAPRPWAVNGLLKNSGADAAIWSLTTDGDQVFGTGYDYYGPYDFEGSFAARADGGALDWVAGCRGDTYDVAVEGDVVYTAGHPHDCEMVGSMPEQTPRTHLRALATTRTATRLNTYGTYSGRPAPSALHWLPAMDVGSVTGQRQAAWTVDTGSGYVVMGGEFPTVNGTRQAGLVRFTTRDRAPRAQGPNGYAPLTPTADAAGPGAVRLRWQAAWDRDDATLTYELLRGAAYSSAVVVGRLERSSASWDRPVLALTDRTAPAGSSQSYRVRVRDADGNEMVSPTVVAQVPAGTAAARTAYGDAVLERDVVAYWPMGEPSGTVARDEAGVDDLALAGATRGVAGAPGTGTATRLPGSGAVPGASTVQRRGPLQLSVEAWVRTTSTRGGKLVGFGTSRTGGSPGGYDRHLYLSDDGRVVFGAYPGAIRTVESGPGLADGRWHHVVGTLGDEGMTLYVDGARVASRADTTSGDRVAGYWRVGGDTLSGWPRTPSSTALAGDVDDVAVYAEVLDAATVARHHALGTGTPAPPPAPVAPVASARVTADGLTVALDGSASSDPDGEVRSWSWATGDGRTVTGRTATHTYAAAGTYRVTLTVTDATGLTGTTSTDVTVTAPVTPPPATGPLAADDFSRQVTSGLGTAPTGGAWTVSGSTTRSSVSGGAARVLVDPSRTAVLRLPGVSAADVDLVQTVALDTAATGGGAYVAPVVRHTDAADYRVRLRLQADGSTTALLQQRSGTTERSLGTQVVVPGVGSAPGRSVAVRLQVTGTAPAQLRAKVWDAAGAEPSAWTLQATDASADVQGEGAVGLSVYTSGSSTAATALRYDDVRAVRP
ncbi:PKD domain-containing protein [Pseudokineococcus lusitanus]|uniref:PKD repeat protein n=1 Tax=Pseudokineococcus lusitanus TaxID=763993 RepID=A0A3N1HKL3_9ACTN|nr:PKD domain-containing protein [Pseudokineococcus lusitanus]ROP42991.1 PKD repeat protein [Pseudokineococcus lusitanus]